MKLLKIFSREADSKSFKNGFRKGVRSMAGYLGASKDRLFSDWNAHSGSADSVLSDSLTTLRDRCRDFERNNEYFAWYLNLMRTNVVGSEGMKLQVKANNPDGSMDVPGSQMVEDAWRNFCRFGVPTVDGRMTMTDVLSHVTTSMARDGEAIALKSISRNYPAGIALQFIEPDMLDETLNQDARNGNPIRMGVELDKNTRRPVAYHFLTQHPGDSSYTTYNGASKHNRVLADKVVHVFRQDRAGQTRGAPWGSAALRALKMLHGYREAELVAARMGASKMGFFTSKSGDGFVGDDFEDGSGGRDGLGDKIMNVSPGSFHELPADVDFKGWDPSHPNAAFADFEKAILRGVASALGVNYTALANDFEGISYSSIRHGALGERDYYKMVQRMVINQFLDPVYKWWLEYAMDFGILPFNGKVKYDKFYTGSTWRPRGFAWVDPQKEMKAFVEGLQNGLVSHSEIAATQGRDIDDVFAQIASDKEAAKRHGLEMNYDPFGEASPAPDTGKGGDDDEEE